MLQNKEAWLQQSKLGKMLCTGHREFGTNRWRFLSKANTLYFRLCKICELMKCILIVNHQLNRMHPWCSWECTLPGRCSPGKRCHTFWNRNIVLLPIRLSPVKKSLIRHHFVLSYLLFYCPRKETTCPIGFLGQFYVRKVTCPQSADGVFISKNAFINNIQIVKITNPAFLNQYDALHNI